MAPGYVVLSSTTSRPGARQPAISSAAVRTNERSGSRFGVNGVGTQIRKASRPAAAAHSVSATSRPAWTWAATSASGTSAVWLSPRRTAATRAASGSIPVTRKPARANSTARGSPT